MIENKKIETEKRPLRCPNCGNGTALFIEPDEVGELLRCNRSTCLKLFVQRAANGITFLPRYAPEILSREGRLRSRR